MRDKTIIIVENAVPTRLPCVQEAGGGERGGGAAVGGGAGGLDGGVHGQQGGVGRRGRQDELQHPPGTTVILM